MAANVETDLKFVQSNDKASPENKSSEGEDASPETEFLREESTEVASEEILTSQPQVSAGSSLPGGYDRRHRKPSYCNADRSSWWELQALASHVHPSVATCRSFNPLNDLSLTSFLNKLMEKKPKQTAS
ncbi:CCAAT-binding factor [Euphorbia peplus]|nr:CCAAT-binding factor [Euphorbia peplus]